MINIKICPLLSTTQLTKKYSNRRMIHKYFSKTHPILGLYHIEKYRNKMTETSCNNKQMPNKMIVGNTIIH